MCRLKWLIACQLLILATTTWGQSRISEVVNNYAEAYADIYGFTGNVMVILNDEEIIEHSYGLADRSFEIPNSKDVRFSINSISKIFTVVAVLQLVENGQVMLQSPVSAYIPELTAEWSDSVTVHQLLTHSSGLPRESGIQPCDQLTLDEQIGMVNDQELLFASGSKYGYSNSGIILLGAILEGVTGGSYDDYIKSTILRPLGLKNTGFYKGRNVVDSLAVPYRLTANGLETVQRTKHFGDNPGGGMYSTTSDLYEFILGLESYTVLSKKFTDLMLKSHIQSGENEFEGYGWSIKMLGNHKLYMAAGSGYGTKSVMIRVPHSGIFIAIASNWGNTPILNLLGDLYLTIMGENVELPSTDGLADPEMYSQAMGTYQFDRDALSQHLGIEGDRLVLQAYDNKLFLDDELLMLKGDYLLGLTYTDELTIELADETMRIRINGNELLGVKSSDE